MSLCRFCTAVKYMLCLPWLYQLKVVGDVTTKTNLIVSCPTQQCLPILPYCWARLNGADIASTQKVWTSTILKWLKAWDYKLPHRGPLQWHHLHTKFHPNPPIGTKLIVGGGGAHRQTRKTAWRYYKPPFHFKKVGYIWVHYVFFNFRWKENVFCWS
jgi:hypothetical protein